MKNGKFEFPAEAFSFVRRYKLILSVTNYHPWVRKILERRWEVNQERGRARRKRELTRAEQIFLMLNFLQQEDIRKEIENRLPKDFKETLDKEKLEGAISKSTRETLQSAKKIVIKEWIKAGKIQVRSYMFRVNKNCLGYYELGEDERRAKRDENEYKKLEQIYNSLNSSQQEEIKTEIENRLPDSWKVPLNKEKIKMKTLKKLLVFQEEKKREIIKEWIDSGRIEV